MDLTAIDRLACEYLKHEQLYRRGRSEITDQEFDAIEKELIRVAPDHPAFRCVESGRKLLSLGNQAPENWLKTLPENTKLIVQPKIDGVAIALRYVNGKLVKAWTRKGVDKTERIKLVELLRTIAVARALRSGARECHFSFVFWIRSGESE